MVGMYRIGEFARPVGRSSSTLRWWEREGRITARWMASGQRFFTDADVRRVLQPGFDETARQTVVYCRVSAPGQKDDLNSQDQIERGEVGTVVIAHKDRLARFGYDYLEYVAEKNGCAILVANQESLSPREEMVQDLLAIVHTLSCRLQGLRGYERTLKAELGGGR